ncbi:GNAT family N-acetyltransferase [Staphylococcus saccharolyticus]|uniref:GNAT family N-acetyltransferase n=1 Tax=Staphylococcus saccharolyticus TaxID=33028 RepID=UPI00102DD74B|nr:GNAT family N-acetyltransferase [Staphylococcus saccharolyticus]MBL7572785.1 GNAT family N-acetyltransferase [Staphylococcus saccharolyticus]MBL7584279.1 GNAT family N-acetyltransferase [Staphylococcus saccharolyticus]MBL7638402.1 GNAT family N-acetyltransferase [Staphylococcus saccharolyticus]QRJ68093.1 GNAT family N-acetyltransferase [Staphylococcus saccharolyticus]TAA93323.1 GNAT family N-acetyltransferase [Staphylococcus saccharolyticus]
MNNIRLLNQDDLESYIELMSNGYHSYDWDRYYLEHVSKDRLNKILSQDTKFWNIFGAFEKDQLAATCTLKQMNYVGKNHKAVLENNFVKDNDEIVNRELINYIIHYAREHQIEMLMTTIASNNISAKVFFSSIGFENLAFEKNASKIGDEYFDENWLIYYVSDSLDSN